MISDELTRGPIMRLFQVRAKDGHADILRRKFATTSADVVRHEPGNLGYFFGNGVEKDENVLLFVSLWKDLEAIKKRFGEVWQESFLPEGYEDLILEHSLCHIDMTEGWFVSPDKLR
ncbi:MAG: antibiotic biosynthesis monooxygenase [Pseudomonadota bacterium]